MNYRSNPALGSSDLKNILTSPRTFLDGRQNNKSSSSMDLGILCHVLLLEPETYNDRYAIFLPTHKVNTNLWKEEKKKFKELNKGKKVITQKVLDDAKMITEEFSGAPVLEKCDKEKAFYAEYEIDGFKFKLKCLCDAVDTKRHIIFDYKTTRDVSMWECTLEKYKYYLQDYHYRMVYSTANNVPLEDVRFIFLLSDTRNGYSFITQLDEETQYAGEIEHHAALQKYKEFCQDKKLSIEDAPYYPAEKIPAFDLRTVVQTGLKPYALRKILNKQNQGEEV